MSEIRTDRATEDLFAMKNEVDARECLVERYLPLARHLARRYVHTGQPLDDLEQVASIGLIKAIDRYDAKKGFKFESFAVPTILGELKRYHRDRGWSVRVPRQLQERALRIRSEVPLLAQELKRSPMIREIAVRLGMSQDEVLEALDAQEAYASVSIDAPIAGEVISLADRLASDDEDEIDNAELWVLCEPHLRRLPERERRLIELRYFQDRTQSEIAAELGISQMHVSRLLSQTLQSLRQAIGA